MTTDHGRAENTATEGVRFLGTVAHAEECERVGHDLPSGLRWDEMRRAMVTDCRRCGYVARLVQGSDA